MERVLSGVGLPSPHNHVYVNRFECDSIADAADSFSSDDCRAASQKRIQDDVVARCTVQNGIGDHLHGFERRMNGDQTFFLIAMPEDLDPRVLPRLRPRATEFSQLNIIAVGLSAILERKN